MKIVIIGGGAAAVSAVETIRSVDAVSEVTVISASRDICSICLLPYYLSGSIDEGQTMFRDAGFYDDMKVEAIFDKALKVVPSRNSVQLAGGGEVQYDQLLIANGASPAIPEVGGLDKEGVFYFNTLDDTKRIAEWSKKASRAAVIGVGFIGVQAAMSLRKRGLNVSILGRRDRVLPRMLNKEMARPAEERLAKNGIDIVLQRQVKELSGGDVVNGVVLSQGKVECDMVVVAAGVQPNIDIVAGTEVGVNEGILVDENMRTSVGNIYAAGDVVETVEVITGERRINAIWPNAMRQGRIAALNMLGRKCKYEGSENMNVIDIYGLPIVSIGREVPGAEELCAPGKRILLKDNRIVLITFVGTVKNIGILRSLMLKGQDVSEIRDSLLSDRFGYGKVLKYESAGIS